MTLTTKKEVVTRAALAQRIHEELGIPFTEASSIVDDFFEAITYGLETRDSVQLKGFGKFEVREWKGRLGRNIKTGETVEIEPSAKVHFKPSRTLTKRIAKYAGPGIE